MRHGCDVIHVAILKPLRQFAGDVARPVVGQQTRTLTHPRPITARCYERQVQRVGDILGFHGGAQLPGDDVAGEVVQDGAMADFG